MTAPDLATRLLDMCEKHGVDTGDFVHFKGAWRRQGTTLGVIQATRTEIESLAFRLEDKLEDLGYERQRINGPHEWCEMQEEIDGHAWIPFAEHPDRIEADILAAGKVGGER